MNNFSIQIAILLFLGLALSEISSLVYYIWPQTAVIEFDLFIQRSFKQKISVLWYIFELANILDRIIWAYALFRVAAKISYRLEGIALVFFGYYIIQFLLYGIGIQVF